jgi:hypothetical protein
MNINTNWSTSAQGWQSRNLGARSTDGDFSIAIGTDAEADNDQSVAIGTDAETTAD